MMSHLVLAFVVFHAVAAFVGVLGRLAFGIQMVTVKSTDLNERLDALDQPIRLAKKADIGLAVAALTGSLLFWQADVAFTDAHWALKIKTIMLLLVAIAISAFYIALNRVVNHYDQQMVPALQRHNTITVLLGAGIIALSFLL